MAEIVEQQTSLFDAEAVRFSEQPPFELLNAVDWDFPKRISHSGIEGMHPYPAKFITEIPRALLATLPIPRGTVVLDPFCGSGSTLVECQRRGFPSIGVDLNPIACLMSRIKTARCPPDLEDHALEAVELAKAQPAATIPAIPNLDHWFERAVQKELASLTKAIYSLPPGVRDCLKLALSSIIVRVSNQESDTRYAAVHKDIAPTAVSALFLRSVARIGTALRARAYTLTAAQVIEGNILKIKPEQLAQPIGLVITSPPYPNAYEYWLYHKYRMWWLGFDPLSVRAQEIGARAHFFKKNHHTAQDFVHQMQQTFALLGRIVVPNAYVCFVVGRSRIHGQVVDNAKIIEEAGSVFGFQYYFSAERVLSAHRKSFNLSHANIKTEKILVLKKEKS